MTVKLKKNIKNLSPLLNFKKNKKKIANEFITNFEDWVQQGVLNEMAKLREFHQL